MFAYFFYTLILVSLNIFKCEKIELEDFELDSNQLYPLSKFTYNNYSRNSPINQGFDFSLKSYINQIDILKNNSNSLFYFYFILSKPSLSIYNSDRFCRYGLVGKEDINDDKISFIKKYKIFKNPKAKNLDESDNNYLENGIKEKFLFNEIGVKQYYLYFCAYNEEDEEKMKKININLNRKTMFLFEKEYDKINPNKKTEKYLILKEINNIGKKLSFANVKKIDDTMKDIDIENKLFSKRVKEKDSLLEINQVSTLPSLGRDQKLVFDLWKKDMIKYCKLTLDEKNIENAQLIKDLLSVYS